MISVEDLTREESLIEELVEREDTIGAIRLNQHRNSNSRTTRLQKVSAKKRWKALKRPRNAIQTEVELLQNVVKSRRAEPPVDFLRGKAAADREIRQQIEVT